MYVRICLCLRISLLTGWHGKTSSRKPLCLLLAIRGTAVASAPAMILDPGSFHLNLMRCVNSPESCAGFAHLASVPQDKIPSATSAQVWVS